MKAKGERNTFLNKQATDLGKQQTQVGKMLSPKNMHTKVLTSYKSEKDLAKKISDKPEKDSNVELSTSFVEGLKTEAKKKQLIIKQVKQLKNEVKNVNSPKISSHLSPRTTTAKFFRSKNQPHQNDETKIKKTSSQLSEKQEGLEKKCQQLEIQISILKHEKEMSAQIINQLALQKQALQKNLQRLKNVASENRRLLKQKADGFNSTEEQLKNLKQQINQLMKQKSLIKEQLCDAETITDPIQQTVVDQNKKQNQILDISNQTKVESSVDYVSMLSDLHFDEGSRFALLKEMFEKIIYEKDARIQERQELICQQQKELNDFYGNRGKISHEGLNLAMDEALLLQIHQNIELKKALGQQNEKAMSYVEELRNKERQIDTLKREVKMKDIFYQVDTAYPQVFSQSRLEKQSLRKQLHEAKEKLKLHQSTVIEQQRRLEQQESIIKSLKDKKPKVIVK